MSTCRVTIENHLSFHIKLLCLLLQVITLSPSMFFITWMALCVTLYSADRKLAWKQHNTNMDDSERDREQEDFGQPRQNCVCVYCVCVCVCVCHYLDIHIYRDRVWVYCRGLTGSVSNFQYSDPDFSHIAQWCMCVHDCNYHWKQDKL